MKKALIIAACMATAALFAASAQASSTCYVCSCNETYDMCKIDCSTSASAASLQSCSFSCQRTYASCMDSAYAAMSAESQANQATLDTTTSSSSN